MNNATHPFRVINESEATEVGGALLRNERYVTLSMYEDGISPPVFDGGSGGGVTQASGEDGDVTLAIGEDGTILPVV